MATTSFHQCLENLTEMTFENNKDINSAGLSMDRFFNFVLCRFEKKGFPDSSEA